MTSNRKLILATAVVLTLAIAALQSPIRSALLSVSVVRSDSPSEVDLDQFTAQSPARLAQLWQTRKIVHRLYVASQFRDHPDQPLILSAIHTRDPDLQQPAFLALLKNNAPLAAREALALLADPDSEVILLALRTLASADQPESMPHVLPLLSHTNPSVAIAAHNTLLRLAHDPALEFNVLSPPERAAAIAAWEGHLTSAGLPLTPAPVPPAPIDTLLPSPINLTTLDGKPVRLEDLRGKPVLINFWATWCGPCIMEMPTLVALQAHYGDRLVIVSICVDSAAGPTPAHPPLADRVRTLAAKWKLNFPVSLDTTGDTTAAYAASGVPLTVLVSPSGEIHRRFNGPRPIEEFKRMIDALR